MSTTEENKNIILRWVDARNRCDLESALPLWADVWQEALSRNFSVVTNTFPDIHITIEDLVAEGDKVVLYATMHGTHSGPFLGVEATGKTVAIPNIDIYQVTNGKIEGVVRVTDGLEALNQMGVPTDWVGKIIT